MTAPTRCHICGDGFAHHLATESYGEPACLLCLFEAHPQAIDELGNDHDAPTCPVCAIMPSRPRRIIGCRACARPTGTPGAAFCDTHRNGANDDLLSDVDIALLAEDDAFA